MDIKQIHQENLHEKYLMQQMDEKERAEYEAFLETHPEMRTEMEDLRQLIHGIRAIGHQKMKAEIAAQIKEQNSQKIDWGMYYKLAAVVLLFVLLPSVIYIQNQNPMEIPTAVQAPQSADEVREKRLPDKSLQKDESRQIPPLKIDKPRSPSKAVDIKKSPPKQVAAASKIEKPKQKIQTAGSSASKPNFEPDIKAKTVPRENNLQELSQTSRAESTGKMLMSKKKRRRGIIAGDRQSPSQGKKVFRYPLKSTAIVLTLLRTRDKTKTSKSLNVFVRYQKDSTITLTAQVPDDFYSLPQSFVHISKEGSIISINFNERAFYQIDIKAPKPVMKLMDATQPLLK